MPNNVVFNYSAEELKTQIFGYTGTLVKEVTVDSNGYVGVAGSVALTNATVTVGGSVALTNATVTVGGSVALTNETVTVGGSVTVGSGTVQVYPICTTDSYLFSNIGAATTIYAVTVQDLSTVKEYGYYVKNTSGTATIDVIIQLSPITDTSYYITAASKTNLAISSSTLINAAIFMKYARIGIVNNDSTFTAAAEVYFNGQSS